MPNILHLTLYKKYFDNIKSGKKDTEYRDNTEYWRKRLFFKYPDRLKYFTEIHFRNGYGKHRPLVKTEHWGTHINHLTNKIEILLGDLIT